MKNPANKQMQQSRDIPVPPFTPPKKSLRDALIKEHPEMASRLATRESCERDKELYRANSGLNLLHNEAHEIENWPDYKFSTEDGRTFALFLHGDSILKRLDAAGAMINRADKEGIDRLNSIDGMILEVGSEEPPLVFDDYDHLREAWAEMHFLYGVKPSEEQWDALELSQFLEVSDEDEDAH